MERKRAKRQMKASTPEFLQRLRLRRRLEEMIVQLANDSRRG